MDDLGQNANLSEIELGLSILSQDNLSFASSSCPDSNGLLSDEILYLDNFKSQKRKQQFIMGRNAARKALTELCSSDILYATSPLKRLESGLVDWPAGILGSISHSNDFAIAVVCNEKSYRGLGIDLELHREINPGVHKKIALLSELQIASSINSVNKSDFFAIFSAKESIFKAIYPNIKQKFGFLAVELKSTTLQERYSDSIATYKLEFLIVEDLSREYYCGIPISVSLYSTNSFSLTLCALPGLSYT